MPMKRRSISGCKENQPFDFGWFLLMDIRLEKPISITKGHPNKLEQERV